MNRKTIVLALVLAFAVGGYIGDESRKQPERPVLRFLAKVARWGLWVMVVGDQPKQPEPQYTRAAPGPGEIDHLRSL